MCIFVRFQSQRGNARRLGDYSQYEWRDPCGRGSHSGLRYSTSCCFVLLRKNLRRRTGNRKRSKLHFAENVFLVLLKIVYEFRSASTSLILTTSSRKSENSKKQFDSMRRSQPERKSQRFRAPTPIVMVSCGF